MPQFETKDLMYVQLTAILTCMFLIAQVSPEMYFHMTHLLTGLAEGNVVVALEGGYNLNSISLSMTMCTKALLKDPAPPLARPYKPPKPSCLESIRETARHLRPYWPCLDNLCYR